MGMTSEETIKGLEDVRGFIKKNWVLPVFTLKMLCNVDDALALLKSLYAFKAYFDSFYGEGLEIANYHQNGAMEPFDNFYDSAMEEYANAGSE